MNDIIKDFHELTEIPVFQEMVPDKKYMDTAEYLDFCAVWTESLSMEIKLY